MLKKGPNIFGVSYLQNIVLASSITSHPKTYQQFSKQIIPTHNHSFVYLFSSF